MHELIIMCIEFFKTGLFSVGGGLATLPFLTQMSKTHPNWFSLSELTNIVAVAESTPGPIGVNMSTFVGFKNFGALGGVVATLSLVLPSFIIVLIVAKTWEKYMNNDIVKRTFSTLRAAAIGLIFSAGFTVFMSGVFPGFSGLAVSGFAGVFSALTDTFNFPAFLLFAIMMIGTQLPQTKKFHPLVFIIIAAFIGIFFKF